MPTPRIIHYLSRKQDPGQSSQELTESKRKIRISGNTPRRTRSKKKAAGHGASREAPEEKQRKTGWTPHTTGRPHPTGDNFTVAISGPPPRPVSRTNVQPARCPGQSPDAAPHPPSTRREPPPPRCFRHTAPPCGIPHTTNPATAVWQGVLEKQPRHTPAYWTTILASRIPLKPKSTKQTVTLLQQSN